MAITDEQSRQNAAQQEPAFHEVAVVAFRSPRTRQALFVSLMDVVYTVIYFLRTSYVWREFWRENNGPDRYAFSRAAHGDAAPDVRPQEGT